MGENDEKLEEVLPKWKGNTGFLIARKFLIANHLYVIKTR